MMAILYIGALVEEKGKHAMDLAILIPHDVMDLIRDFENSVEISFGSSHGRLPSEVLELGQFSFQHLEIRIENRCGGLQLSSSSVHPKVWENAESRYETCPSRSSFKGSAVKKRHFPLSMDRKKRLQPRRPLPQPWTFCMCCRKT